MYFAASLAGGCVIAITKVCAGFCARLCKEQRSWPQALRDGACSESLASGALFLRKTLHSADSGCII